MPAAPTLLMVSVQLVVEVLEDRLTGAEGTNGI